MPNDDPTFDIGVDILGSTRNPDTGAVLIQTGDSITGDAEAQNTELWFPPGFWGIPANPTAGSPSAQAICIKATNGDKCIAVRDLRTLGLTGNGKPGEAGIYAVGADGTGQAQVVCKQDGSASLLTTEDNTPTGATVSLRVSGDALLFVAPWGVFEFSKANGLRVVHESGAQLTAGPLAGAPAPFDVLSSQVSISAAVVNIKTPLVCLGTGTFAQCATLATPGTPGASAIASTKVLIAL